MSQDKLNLIALMIKEYQESKDMLLSTKFFLDRILCVINDEEMKVSPKQKQLEHIIISCDASIKKNPGGPSAIGCVIQFPTELKRPNLIFSQITPDTTNNLAEYGAVYCALTTLMDLFNRPQYKVEIRSDSQLLVKQIKDEINCNNEQLKKKRDIIRELINSIPVEVELVWRPRNSTPELETANFEAQKLLGVKLH